MSIITPAYNRGDELGSLIGAVQAQTFPHDQLEMLIVDDGSEDDTEQVVKKWAKEVDFELRYLFQNNEGPGAARNLGMKRARGDLFLFTDSDCEPEEHWAEKIVERYGDGKFDAGGGPDASKKDFTPLQRAIDFSMTSFLTTGGLRGHASRPAARFYPRTHNMAMTRKLYEKVGGFGDLRHGQDIELSHRIRKSGARVIHIPEAVVYHRRRTSLKRFFRQVFNWGVARVNLGKIDGDMLEPLHFVPAILTVILFVILIGFLINPDGYNKLVGLAVGLLMVVAGVGALKQENGTVGLYLFAVIPLQIVGYGLGFIAAFIRRFVFNRGPWTGFSKRYYR